MKNYIGTHGEITIFPNSPYLYFEDKETTYPKEVSRQ